MTVPGLQVLVQAFIGSLLNTIAEGVVLTGLIWLLFRLIGRQNSGTRFAVWFSALLAIVALPFLSEAGFGASHSQVLPPASLHRELLLSGSCAFYLFAAWAVGAGVLLLGLGIGLRRVRQIRRNCSDADIASLDPAIGRILRDFNSRRRVNLCVSDGVALPAAIGFFRPAIVFPAWLLPQLSPEEIKVILLHELAHLRRWDDWTNLAQKLVKAVFFFHPAVWWIEKRLTLEREMACDDVVLAQSVSPRAYASSLISFAEKLQNARGLALAQALVSRMHEMSLRVTQILDAKRSSRTGLWKPVLGLGAGLLALAMGAVPYVPQFVAFQSEPTQSRMQTVGATRQPANAKAQPGVERAMIPGVLVPLAHWSSLASQPQAIPAAFNPRMAAVPTQLRRTTPSSMALRARATQDQVPIRETVVILQTARYDASGVGVWTVCVWRFRGGRPATERQFESAIVLSSI